MAWQNVLEMLGITCEEIETLKGVVNMQQDLILALQVELRASVMVVTYSSSTVVWSAFSLRTRASNFSRLCS